MRGDALVSRINVDHAYNKEVALEIVEAVRDRYYGMFEALKNEVEFMER